MTFASHPIESLPQVLITDDDRDFRDALAEALTRRGFGLLLASDGCEAIEIICEQPVHLMLVDMHMPRLSGLETLASLQKLEIEMPCVLMSAGLDDGIVDRAKGLNTSSVLAKPFSLQTITSVIRHILFDRYGWVA
ncbi:MAG: response regulator [Pirellulaceae bacterium]|nr:response regulator [Pirellulaceae bacterium]